MKSLTKIIVFTILISFLGLLSLGTVANMSASINQHSDGIDPVRSDHTQQDTASHAKQTSGGVDCFGAGCGPIEHMVMHNYLVTEMADGREYIEYYHQNFADNNSILQSPEIAKESPPPKFSLV